MFDYAMIARELYRRYRELRESYRPLPVWEDCTAEEQLLWEEIAYTADQALRGAGAYDALRRGESLPTSHYPLPKGVQR